MICKNCDCVVHETFVRVLTAYTKQSKQSDRFEYRKIWVHFSTNDIGCRIPAKTTSLFIRKSLKRITRCGNCGRDLAVAYRAEYAERHKYWAHIDTRNEECHYEAEPLR